MTTPSRKRSKTWSSWQPKQQLEENKEVFRDAMGECRGNAPESAGWYSSKIHQDKGIGCVHTGYVRQNLSAHQNAVSRAWRGGVNQQQLWSDAGILLHLLINSINVWSIFITVWIMAETYCKTWKTSICMVVHKSAILSTRVHVSGSGAWLSITISRYATTILSLQ